MKKSFVLPFSSHYLPILMEIETKIFDIKRVRKVLDKKNIEPKRVCDVVDYLFDIAEFSAEGWRYTLPVQKKS